MTETTNHATDDTSPDANRADDGQFESGTAVPYAVLAECWREPTERLVAALGNGALTTVVGHLDSVDGKQLRTEYARLFIGPSGPPCPPYESVYRDRKDGDDAGPVMGPATIAVGRWYREFGIEPARDHADLPDHIATELEFAAYLAEERTEARLEQFLDEHLRVWADEFLTRVETETREAFYSSLAATTREVLL